MSMASHWYSLAGICAFVIVSPSAASLKDSAYKLQLLDAINAKRAEFGFTDKFALAEKDSKDAGLLKESYKSTRGDYVYKDTPERLDLKRFEASRPLYFQVGYFAGEAYNARGNDLSGSLVVEIWSHQSSPDKAIPKDDDTQSAGLRHSRDVMFMSDGLWPFVTNKADQNLIIERGVGRRELDYSFTVLFPGYENAKVPTEQRKEFAQTKTLERCFAKKAAEYQMKLQKFMCNAINLDKRNNYKMYKEGINEFIGCVHETLWEGFRQEVDAREMIVVEVCSDRDIFKKKTGVTRRLEFKDALNADASISPFAKFNTLQPNSGAQ